LDLLNSDLMKSDLQQGGDRPKPMVSHSIFQRAAMWPGPLKFSNGLPGDVSKNVVDPSNSLPEKVKEEKTDTFSPQIKLPSGTEPAPLSGQNYFDMVGRSIALMIKMYGPKFLHTTQDEMPRLGLDATKEIAKDEHSEHQKDQNNNNGDNSPAYAASASAKSHKFPGRMI
jgi:hypothetical protein